MSASERLSDAEMKIYIQYRVGRFFAPQSDLYSFIQAIWVYGGEREDIHHLLSALIL